jgi:hypothetical protein
VIAKSWFAITRGINEEQIGPGRGNIKKATAAAVAIGSPGEATAEERTARTTNVRVIDIHAHYFPETYLDLVASDGKRFDAAYYTTDKGWFRKTPAGGIREIPKAGIHEEYSRW